MGFAAGIFILTLALIISHRVFRRVEGSRMSVCQPEAPYKTGSSSVMLGIDITKKSPVPSIPKQDVMQVLRPVMAAVITVVLLGVSLFIVLSKSFDESSKKWAFGTIGTIIGFWLK
jgi:hypothetical protein